MGACADDSKGLEKRFRHAVLCGYWVLGFAIMDMHQFIYLSPNRSFRSVVILVALTESFDI